MIVSRPGEMQDLLDRPQDAGQIAKQTSGQAVVASNQSYVEAKARIPVGLRTGSSEDPLRHVTGPCTSIGGVSAPKPVRAWTSQELGRVRAPFSSSYRAWSTRAKPSANATAQRRRRLFTEYLGPGAPSRAKLIKADQTSRPCAEAQVNDRTGSPVPL